MAVRDERKWEDVRPLGPEAPQLTVKQGKLLALLCNLEKRELFCQIVDDFLKFSRFILFGVERLHQYRLYQLANLSRFYVTLCRFKGNFSNEDTSYLSLKKVSDGFCLSVDFLVLGDEVTARLFLYDILFMKNARTHVIISIYLVTLMTSLLFEHLSILPIHTTGNNK